MHQMVTHTQYKTLKLVFIKEEILNAPNGNTHTV